ncbi:MAG: BMP family ABC transporter substrate-binding protein [Clostridia bacterium]|nr:BMP family ABC transporter substrate-binding protein [Clostridia bacterium]
MKKLIALLMVLAMVFALVACTAKPADKPAEQPGTVDPESIPDTMTSADGTYEIAFVTDVGQLKDKSFNQGTWEGCKLYAAANNKSYKYYQPANADKATDDDRYDAMKAAADGGAKVIVCAGFMQGNALARAAADFPEVNFIFIDGWAFDGLNNIAGIAYQEEQAGYLAGYAVVMEGYTKLGFCGGGGGTNPACCRYGYGFVQGANAAAAEKGITVDIKYSWQYGASFSASPELQTMAAGWYESGTEIIFACGGSMFASIVAAAGENDAKVVGVDVDQSPESGTVVTSAMKGLSVSVEWAIAKHFDGKWDEIGGKATSLGAANDAVGLPVDTWSLKNWTVADYEKLFASMKDGTLVVDPNFPEDNVFNLSNAKVEVI